MPSDAELREMLARARAIYAELEPTGMDPDRRWYWANQELERGFAAEGPRLLDRIEVLEKALSRIEAGDEPRPIGKMWRSDAKPCKNDKCIHDIWMYETCGNCVSDFARTAIEGGKP